MIHQRKMKSGSMTLYFDEWRSTLSGKEETPEAFNRLLSA
jgi:hypothetical protein